MRAKVTRDDAPRGKTVRPFKEWEFVLVLDGSSTYLALISYRQGTRHPGRKNPIWEAAYGSSGSRAHVPSRLAAAKRLSLDEVSVPADVQDDARKDLVRQINQIKVKSF